LFKSCPAVFEVEVTVRVHPQLECFGSDCSLLLLVHCLSELDFTD